MNLNFKIGMPSLSSNEKKNQFLYLLEKQAQVGNPSVGENSLKPELHEH